MECLLHSVVSFSLFSKVARTKTLDFLQLQTEKLLTNDESYFTKFNLKIYKKFMGIIILL